MPTSVSTTEDPEAAESKQGSCRQPAPSAAPNIFARVRAEAVTIYLSRGEIERGRVDPDWFLVVCRVDGTGTASLEGWCTTEELEPVLPADKAKAGQGSSVEIELAPGSLCPGLPLGLSRFIGSGTEWRPGAARS